MSEGAHVFRYGVGDGNSSDENSEPYSDDWSDDGTPAGSTPRGGGGGGGTPRGPTGPGHGHHHHHHAGALTGAASSAEQPMIDIDTDVIPTRPFEGVPGYDPAETGHHPRDAADHDVDYHDFDSLAAEGQAQQPTSTARGGSTKGSAGVISVVPHRDGLPVAYDSGRPEHLYRAPSDDATGDDSSSLATCSDS